MAAKKRGMIVILSSPSGAGKTTLVKKISNSKSFKISISHTTRTPRKNENDGLDYFFISMDEFKKLISENKFLEYAKVFNNYYGSSKEKVIKSLEKGENVIFDIDWQGTEQIKEKNLNYKIITFFILPPSREELYQRLLKREFNETKVVNERMNQFDKDVLKWKSYDFVVINDDLKKCYNQIIELIDKKIKGIEISNYNTVLIDEHVKKLLK